MKNACSTNLVLWKGKRNATAPPSIGAQVDYNALLQKHGLETNGKEHGRRLSNATRRLCFLLGKTCPKSSASAFPRIPCVGSALGFEGQTQPVSQAICLGQTMCFSRLRTGLEFMWAKHAPSLFGACVSFQAAFHFISQFICLGQAKRFSGFQRATSHSVWQSSQAKWCFLLCIRVGKRRSKRHTIGSI